MTDCHVYLSTQLSKHAQSQTVRVLLMRRSTTWWPTKSRGHQAIGNFATIISKKSSGIHRCTLRW